MGGGRIQGRGGQARRKDLHFPEFNEVFIRRLMEGARKSGGLENGKNRLTLEQKTEL